jgi:hypothetical protein
VSYPLTGTRYNWLVVGATTLGTPPPSTPVSSGPWQYLSTAGTQNTTYWVAQYDGEPFWNSAVQYYAGDVVSYTESATPPTLYTARVANLGEAPEVSSAYWKPFASGSVSSLTAGAGVSVSSATGAITVANTGVLSVLAGAGLSVSGTNPARTLAIDYGVATVVIAPVTPSTFTFDVSVPNLTSATGVVLLGAPQNGNACVWRIGPAVGTTGAFFVPAPPNVYIPSTGGMFQIFWQLQSPADTALEATLVGGTFKIPYVVLHL